MDKIEQNMLEQVAGLHEVPAGAYNIRSNGKMAGRNTTANIDIITNEGASNEMIYYIILYTIVGK